MCVRRRQKHVLTPAVGLDADEVSVVWRALPCFYNLAHRLPLPRPSFLRLTFFQRGNTIYAAGAMDRNFFLINEGKVSLEVEGSARKGRAR